jgi:ribosomal protein L20
MIVEHGLQHAYKARKQKKRDYRELWIQNVKASTQEFGIKYHQFMYGMTLSGCQLNRKMLSEISQTEPLSMRSIVELSNASRRNYQQYINSQKKLTGEEISREATDPHYIPFPAWASKDVQLVPEFDKVRTEVVAKNLEAMARAEVAEDELYEKKLLEYLAKTKITDPDEDPDI